MNHKWSCEPRSFTLIRGGNCSNLYQFSMNCDKILPLYYVVVNPLVFFDIGRKYLTDHQFTKIGSFSLTHNTLIFIHTLAEQCNIEFELIFFKVNYWNNIPNLLRKLCEKWVKNFKNCENCEKFVSFSHSNWTILAYLGTFLMEFKNSRNTLFGK